MSEFKFKSRTQIKSVFKHIFKERSKQIQLLSKETTSSIRYLVPIPSARNRETNRGFSHTKLLADILSRQLDIPVLKLLLINSYFRKKQSSLGHKARRKNISKAFELKKKSLKEIKNNRNSDFKLKRYTFILIDDVITTGSTLNSAASTLQKHFPNSHIKALTLFRGRAYYKNRTN
jgi:ComF family protein